MGAAVAQVSHFSASLSAVTFHTPRGGYFLRKSLMQNQSDLKKYSSIGGLRAQLAPKKSRVLRGKTPKLPLPNSAKRAQSAAECGVNRQNCAERRITRRFGFLRSHARSVPRRQQVVCHETRLGHNASFDHGPPFGRGEDTLCDAGARRGHL